MATVKQFEDLICWQRARELTKEIYKIFKDLNMAAFKDYGLQDQMQRAAVSVMSNIAEGFERGTKPEFLNYLYIAKGSAGEVRTQLYVALDAGYLDTKTFGYLKGLAEECSKLVESFVQKVKAGSWSGLQHKTITKKDNWFGESLRANGQVYTTEGIKTREEAEKRGLKIIEPR